jgi:hypothetical protein
MNANERIEWLNGRDLLHRRRVGVEASQFGKSPAADGTAMT